MNENNRYLVQIIKEIDPGSGNRVLVAVINRPRDLDIAREQGWYRIPVARAPRRVGADWVAFYLTGAFPPDLGHHVTFYAPIFAYRLATRVELLPQEAAHPRAQNRYFKLEIGALQTLDHPIPSHKLRRITFIPTTLPRLFAAREINDLWDKGRGQDALWAALKAGGIDAERHVELYESGVRYDADFVIECAAAPVIIFCDRQAPPSGPNILSFTSAQMLRQTSACLQQIRARCAAPH